MQPNLYVWLFFTDYPALHNICLACYPPNYNRCDVRILGHNDLPIYQHTLINKDPVFLLETICWGRQINFLKRNVKKVTGLRKKTTTSCGCRPQLETNGAKSPHVSYDIIRFMILFMIILTACIFLVIPTFRSDHGSLRHRRQEPKTRSQTQYNAKALLLL